MFFVLVDQIDGLSVVGHGIELVGSGVFLCLDGREDGFDFSFYLIHVDISHHDDALQVGAVPFLVVGAQEGGFEVVDDAHQSDGHAFAVARARVEFGQLAVEDAHHGAGAHSPLLVDDAALFVDFCRLEQQAVGPVVQDVEAGIDVRVAHGHTVDVVDRFIRRGVGVQVFAKFHADAFAVFDDAVSGEMLSAVEAHMFQEVGQSALVFFLLYGAHFLCDVEVHAVFGAGVVADVVGQSVGQLTVAYGRVHVEWRHSAHLGRGRGDAQRQQQQCHQPSRGKEFSHNVKCIIVGFIVSLVGYSVFGVTNDRNISCLACKSTNYFRKTS